MNKEKFISYEKEGLNSNTQEILAFAERLYHSGLTYPEELKSQKGCLELEDKDANLTPLGSVLLALDHFLSVEQSH